MFKHFNGPVHSRCGPISKRHFELSLWKNIESHTWNGWHTRSIRLCVVVVPKSLPLDRFRVETRKQICRKFFFPLFLSILFFFRFFFIPLCFCFCFCSRRRLFTDLFLSALHLLDSESLQQDSYASVIFDYLAKLAAVMARHLYDDDIIATMSRRCEHY